MVRGTERSRVPGMKVPGNERSREQMVHEGKGLQGLLITRLETEGMLEHSFSILFVPWNIRSHDGTFVLGAEIYIINMAYNS